MYNIASNPEHYLDFLDTDSKTCSGYNEMIDDSDGVNLKKNIIKNIQPVKEVFDLIETQLLIFRNISMKYSNFTLIL